MTPSNALQAGLRTLLRRPAAIAPYYLLALGATMIARTPLLLGVGIAVVVLRVQGRIEPVVGLLEEAEPSVQGQEPSVQGRASSLTQAQQDALLGLATPTVAVVLAVAFLATVVLYVACRGGATAGTIHALFAGLDGRDPVAAGADGIGRDWGPFVAIGVVRTLIFVIGGLGIAAGVGLSATGIGLLLGIPLVLGSLAWLLVGTLLLAFAGPAVAVDDREAIGALAESVRFPVRAPVAFVLYVLTGAVVLVGFAIVAAILGVAGVPRVASLLTALVVAPIIDAVKTGLYAGESDAVATAGPDSDSNSDAHGPPGRGIVSRILAGQRRGLSELAAFVRGHPLLNSVGLALFLVGTGLGWLLTSPYGTRLDPPADVAGVFGGLAFGPFLNIAANNWQVAMSQGFSGIGFGVPTAANLLFNGVLVGSLAGVFEPRTFLALIVPHGIVEIPALAIAGGIGLHLGGAGYAWVRGRVGAPAVGRKLQRATWILVGLFPLFVLAAFVEAFLTPQIAALVL